MPRRLLTLSLLILTASLTAAADQRRPCGPGTGRSPLRLLIAQGVFGADFRPSCRVHDACYGLTGADKKQCDDAFRASLHCACEHSLTPRLCRLVVHVMDWSVRLPVSEKFFGK